MASAWPNPHHQQDHVPSISNSSGPAGKQLQIATQQGVDNSPQSCPCLWCSRPRYDHQAAMPTTDHQNPWFPTNPVAQYANQHPGMGNHTGIATSTNGQTMVRPVGQQVPWGQEDDRYAPRYEAVNFLHASAAPNQYEPDMPVLEGPRRLAERYFNNPESLINAVRFEYGPSGRLQVVIMLEIADIL